MSDDTDEKIFDPTIDGFMESLPPGCYYLAATDVYAQLPGEPMQKASGMWCKVYKGAEFIHLDNLSRGNMVAIEYENEETIDHDQNSDSRPCH